MVVAVIATVAVHHEYRASASSYVAFAVMAACPLVACGIAAAYGRNVLVPALICLAGLMLAFIWLSRFCLVISPEAVSYRSLWHGGKTIRRDEIVQAGFADRTGAFESPITFVIQTRSGSELRINAKVFSRDAVSELCSLESRARES